MEHFQSFKKKHQKIAKKEPIAVTENKDNLILQQNKMLKKQLKQWDIDLVNKEREIAELEM